jgi:hypothetical protein
VLYESLLASRSPNNVTPRSSQVCTRSSVEQTAPGTSLSHFFASPKALTVLQTSSTSASTTPETETLQQHPACIPLGIIRSGSALALPTDSNLFRRTRGHVAWFNWYEPRRNLWLLRRTSPSSRGREVPLPYFVLLRTGDSTCSTLIRHHVDSPVPASCRRVLFVGVW